MADGNQTWQHYQQALADPETLAHFERNLRRIGMRRRDFLALASAVGGSAALASCGGSTGPTTAPTTTTGPAPSGAAIAVSSTAAPTSAPAPTAASGGTAAAASAGAATAPAPSPATASAATTAARSGPESTRTHLSYLIQEPVDNDFNRDTYCGGVVQMHAGLLQYDQDFTPLPDLAESYTTTGPVYTLRIRRGATWSDGQPVRAQDFVYSIKREIDPRTGNGFGSFWDGVIKGAAAFSSAKVGDPNLDMLRDAVAVRAVDDGTLEITGDVFSALIVPQLATWAAVPAREDLVTKYADGKGVTSWTDPNKTTGPVVSSGPYTLTAWKHNQQLDLVRNDKYWNATPIRQKYVSVKIIPDLVKSTLPFENNEIDIQQLPSSEVERFRGDSKLKGQTFPYVYPGTRFLVPDTGHPPFDTLAVRKATILAIDKDRLVNQVGKGVNVVAYAMTAPGVFGYFDDDDNTIKNLQKFDKVAALQALKGTPYEGGRNWPKVTLSYNTGDTDIPAGYPDEIARQVKEAINMDVTLEPLEAKVWNARRFALDLQFLLYRWYQDYPDPHNNYYQVFSLHNKGTARQSYNDPTFDDLCKRGAAEPDRQKRLDLYYQAETRIQSQFAYMPIHWRTDYYAIKPWVQGIPKNKQGYTVPNTNMYIRAWDRLAVTDESPHEAPK